MARIPQWSTLSPPRLFEAWRRAVCADGPVSREVGTAYALRAANKMVKSCAPQTRRRVYTIKDDWIRSHQHSLVLGGKAREEVRYCPRCGGDTTGWSDCPCCDGDGVVSRRTLWAHRFLIDGHEFAFHSYIRPYHVTEPPPPDCNRYGEPFTAAEEAALPLPFCGILKVLEYIAPSWPNAPLLRPDTSGPQPFVLYTSQGNAPYRNAP